MAHGGPMCGILVREVVGMQTLNCRTELEIRNAGFGSPIALTLAAIWRDLRAFVEGDIGVLAMGDIGIMAHGDIGI